MTGPTDSPDLANARVFSGLRRVFGAVPSHVWFWGCLAFVLGVLLAPLWLGSIPPLTDFGGHVQVAHGFERLGSDDPSIWSQVIERRGEWWLPNLLLVRVSALMYPAIDALLALRLLTTLILVLTVLGHVFALERFGRSRWLVFLGLPLFTWNAMVGLGFVNYIAGLACVPWAIGLARRIGTADVVSRRDLVALGLLGIVAFFAHGFASLILMVCVGLVLLLSARPFVRVLWAATMAPSAALWLHWYVETRGAPVKTNWFELGDVVMRLPREAFGVFDDVGDARMVVMMIVPLLASFVIGIIWGPPRARGLRALLIDMAPNLLFVCMLVAYFGLPTYMGDLVVSERLIPLVAWSLLLLPRAPIQRLATRITLCLGAGVAVAVGLQISAGVIRFETEELAPARALMAYIPTDTRAQCVDVQYARPIFQRRPLDHNCDGLLAVERDVYAGGGFADTKHNAVAIRQGRPEKRLFDKRWNDSQTFKHIDWLLVRGNHSRPAYQLARFIGTSAAPGGPTWTLYRSRMAELRAPEFTALGGGPGGAPFALDCPPEHAVSAVTIGLSSSQKLVQNVSVDCSQLDDDAFTRFRRGKVTITNGKPIGTARRTLSCSLRRPIEGMSLRAGLMVDAAAVACAGRPTTQPIVSLFVPPKPELSAWRGGQGGELRELRCPPGMIVTGIHGRRGNIMDALGIACRSIVALREETERVKNER